MNSQSQFISGIQIVLELFAVLNSTQIVDRSVNKILNKLKGIWEKEINIGVKTIFVNSVDPQLS